VFWEEWCANGGFLLVSLLVNAWWMWTFSGHSSDTRKYAMKRNFILVVWIVAWLATTIEGYLGLFIEA
jgi:hypothetical protein